MPMTDMFHQYGINSRRRSDDQLYRPSSWSLYLYSLMNALRLALLRWSCMLADQAFRDFSFWLSGLQPVHSPRWCSWEWVPLSGCVCPIWGSSPAAPFFFVHSVPCKCTHAHVSSFLITSIQVNSGPYGIFHTKDGLLLFWRNHPYDFSVGWKNSNTTISVHFGICIHIACLFNGYFLQLVQSAWGYGNLISEILFL